MALLNISLRSCAESKSSKPLEADYQLNIAVKLQFRQQLAPCNALTLLESDSCSLRLWHLGRRQFSGAWQHGVLTLNLDTHRH